jgi:uncharacterized delta-60 repeat protein
MPQQNNNTAPSFSVGNGKRTLIGYGNVYAHNVFVQDDGKIIVAGKSVTNDLSNLLVVRYNSDGNLDTIFSGDGIHFEPFYGAYESAQSIIVQDDGTIIIAGKANNGTSSNLAIAKYNSNGSLNTVMYGSGSPVPDFNSPDLDQSVVVQKNGKILAIGEIGYRDGNGRWYADFVVNRYDVNGSMDTGFSQDGTVRTNIKRINIAESIEVQQDGKILVAGYGDYDGGSIVLVRYNIDGSLDTNFSADGMLTTQLSSSKAYSTKQQTDGKILVTGTDGTDVVLLRYNNDGSLDTAFSGDGIVTTDLGTRYDAGKMIAIQDDGRIIVACSVDGHASIVRYLSNGSLETIFDQAVVTAQDIRIQKDGKILVVDSAHNNFTVVRYNSDGTLDESLGVQSNTLGGSATYTEGGPAVILDSNVQVYDHELSDAKSYGGASLKLMRHGGANIEDQFSANGTLAPLVAGNNLVVEGVTVGNVIRNSGGELEITFSDNATQILVNSVLQQIAYSNSSDTPSASVKIDWTFSDGTLASQDAESYTNVSLIASNDQPTGNVFINGNFSQYSTLSASNTIEDKDGLGIITYQWKANGNSIQGAIDETYTLTQEEIGKVITVTASYIDGYGTAEYVTSAGSPSIANVNDAPEFIKGKVVTEAMDSESVVLQSDGKILVLGYAATEKDNYVTNDVTIARYTVDGDVDFTFANNGMATTIFYGHDIYESTPVSSYGRSVFVQEDGKILVVGEAQSRSQHLNSVYYDVALVRYNADGSLDNSFSEDGKKTIFLINNHDYGRDVMVQSDGRIVFVGYNVNYWGEDFIIERINSDGSDDMSFTGGYDAVNNSYDAIYYSRAQSVVMQSDGKILVAGYTVTEDNGYYNMAHEWQSVFNNYNFRLLRLNQNGTYDETFGANMNGVVDADITGINDYGHDVVVQSDGKIVIAGQANYNNNLALVRYDAWGMLDTSFGDHGKITTDIDNPGSKISLAVQLDDKLIVAGGNTLFRYNSNGSLDRGFSGDGKTIISEDFNAMSVAIQSDGKILVAGSYSQFGSALFRYNSDGTIDKSFGSIKRTYYNCDTDNPVLIDQTLKIYDADFADGDNYGGATLKISRHGGANSDDVFTSTSNLRPMVEGSDLVVENIVIGTTIKNSDGILSVTLNNNATSHLLESFIHKIAYSNTSDHPAGVIQIDWTFSDGNSGSQGPGGPLSAINSTFIHIGDMYQDTTAPIVIEFTPIDGSTNVAVGSNIALVFSEVIQRGIGPINIRKDSATGSIVESFDTATSNRISISGSDLIIDPTLDLSSNTHYFVTFASGTISDFAGNNYTSTTAYDFTTAGSPGDTTPPTITGYAPADNATNVAVGSNIVLTFSEAIQRGTGLIQLRNGSADGALIENFDAATSNRITITGTTLTIDPTADLAAGTHYYVTFAAGTITDNAGNNFNGTTTYDFTTETLMLGGTAESWLYLASYPDLMAAFGADSYAAAAHYNAYGRNEGRTITFDAWGYLASYEDLRGAFGTDTTAATRHYVQYGASEGRTITFDAWGYLASNGDLINAFGTDTGAATKHYVQYGASEGRSITFDAWSYLASNGDLINAFGTDTGAATKHYVQYGASEGRGITFDALSYLASNGDLINAFGTDTTAATRHYVQYGASEGRTTTFDALSYLASYADLQAAFGTDTAAATRHYVEYGYHEGRTISTFVLTGTEGNDNLIGGSSTDIIYGQGSNDTLDGGGGADTLNGGQGDDTFQFTSASDIGLTAGNRDVIEDFTAGQDQIDLTAIDANTSLAGTQAFSGTLLSTTDPFTQAGQLRFDSSEGILYGNTDIDAEAEFALELIGVTALQVTDLVL